MGQQVKADISMSLDGFITGPNAGVANGLGDGGERLHEWLYGLASWRERHGYEGGLAAGLLDEIQIHLVPSLLGDGVRLFDHPPTNPLELEATRVIESPAVTHLKFRVPK